MDSITVLVINNGIILQFGIIKDVLNRSIHNIILPTTYKTFFVGVTDMYGYGNNGCITRFNYKTLANFEIGYDTLVAVYLQVNKVWLTIGY